MSKLSDRLLDSELSERIKATYEVSHGAIKNDDLIVPAMRNNLDSKDNDLLEITVMRLGLRALDIESLDKIFEIAKCSDKLVKSAAILAMSAIGSAYPRVCDKVSQSLESLKINADRDTLLIIEDELRSLQNV